MMSDAQGMLSGGSLRVLLDATAIPADRGGVGRYVDGLAGALDGPDLIVVCQARDAGVFGRLAPRSKILPISAFLARTPARLLWEQVRLPFLARRLRVDVIASPHYTMPLAARTPVVVTLHDAIFFSEPALYRGGKGPFFRCWTRISLRRAALCLVDSHATAGELVRLAGADPDKLTVAHLGVDPARFSPPDSSQKRSAASYLGLAGRPYVAFLATLEPRKNVPALIRAFVAVAGKMTDPPALVLAGGVGWDDAVAPALAAVPNDITVLTPGYLPAELLSGYLGGAQMVAYPSLGEGFGLPVLEAMACGAPVLTTRRLSLPEVGGDAVAYCGVGAGDIAAGLASLLADQSLRTGLAAAALARARLFSWGATAAVATQTYQRAADLAAGRK